MDQPSKMEFLRSICQNYEDAGLQPFDYSEIATSLGYDESTVQHMLAQLELLELVHCPGCMMVEPTLWGRMRCRGFDSWRVESMATSFMKTLCERYFRESQPISPQIISEDLGHDELVSTYLLTWLDDQGYIALMDDGIIPTEKGEVWLDMSCSIRE